MKKKQGVTKSEWTKKEITFVISKYKAGFSRKEIARAYNEKFFGEFPERTENSIKHCIDVHGTNVTKALPKVLIVDCETKPILAYTWGVWEQNISPEMIVEDQALMSWSAKFLGEDKIYYQDQRSNYKNLTNDKKLMLPLKDLLEQASIVIWHNGDSFDYGKINDRFIEHKIDPPSDYETLDTKKLAKSVFNFPHNSLAYLTGRFCKKYKKLTNKKFNGNKLWLECMKGNKAAWEEMRVYNELDVLSLEELFLILAPYVPKNRKVAAAMRTYNSKKKK